MSNIRFTDKESQKINGFTLVELMVVIVIIGILATFAVFSYKGVSKNAVISSLQSDLSNASSQLRLYQLSYGTYPTSLSNNNKCPLTPTPDKSLCFKASANNSYTAYSSNGKTFTLTEVNTNGLSYTVSDEQSPAVTDPNWITFGSQTWAKNDLNVGTMISGSSDQTDNSTLEKYCYGDDEANCKKYGALYQWGEAMQYTNTEGAQGICPDGSHIPTGEEWHILERQLGMTQEQSELANAWRGTDQGAQMLSGGSSGLNLELSGYRLTYGAFDGSIGASADLWSSTESGGNAWNIFFQSSMQSVYWSANEKTYGFSVRCLKN